jgi:hypothetical protein
MTLPDHIAVADRCASLQGVAAPRLLLAVPAALILTAVPTAAGAKGDLSVAVGRLQPPKVITLGKSAKFTVRYIVRGPLTRRATATVSLLLQNGRNRYLIRSASATVSPAIWTWTVTDELPDKFDAGSYTVTATVRLTRNKTTVDSAKATKTVSVEHTGG